MEMIKLIELIQGQEIEELRNYLVGLSIGFPCQLVNPVNFSTLPGSAGNLCQAEAPGTTRGSAGLVMFA